MDYQTQIRFNSVNDVSGFMQLMKEMSGDIDLCFEHISVDARSVLGVISIVSSALQKTSALTISFSEAEDYEMFARESRALLPQGC